MNFQDLIIHLKTVNEDLELRALRAVNTSLTLRNWIFGFFILEFEQNGSDRAMYGEKILQNIAHELQAAKISNTNERELRRYRQFYMVYQDAVHYILNQNSIRELLPPETNTKPEKKIRELASPELQSSTKQIEKIFNFLSYSHFVELIRIQDSLKRSFYEIESINGTWSVAELKRQIGSSLYERTGLSQNKTKVIALAQNKAIQQTAKDYLRDPYVFEFLELKKTDVILEKQLEKALIQHLLAFILELGKGFCFEAKQKRILIDNEHYFVDLVFYHRLLKCHVLIELKTEKFHHSHSSQLNMYLEYYKKYEMAMDDNPPVGILLCSEKDTEHVAFATAGMDDKIFVSKYLMALPKKEELENFIKNEISKNK